MQFLKSIALAVLMLALAVSAQSVSAAPSNWDGGTIRVTGLGIAPADTRGTQAEALARRAAVSDAYRQLAEQINGVNVDASTTVERLMVMNTTVRTHVSALIKGAQIVEEKAQRDGSYIVTVELPVYGAGSLASTVFAPIRTPEVWTSPASVYQPYTATAYDTTGYGTYDNGRNAASVPLVGQVPGQQPAVTQPPSASVSITATIEVPAAPTPSARPSHPTPSVQVAPPAAPPAVAVPAAPPAIVAAPAAPASPAVTVPAAPPTIATAPAAPAPAVTTPAAPSVPSMAATELVPTGQAVGGYTGVIIDCTGLGLRPVMSPVIKTDNGRPIYGYKNLDSDKVVQNGMASYARTDTDATRAGTNPLRLRAVSVDNNANPVLSADDANRLLLENSAAGFLDATNVVFLR